MARLSQGLIQGLINPSFGPQLGQAGLFAGSMPGRVRAAEMERAKLEAQQKAQASLYQILASAPGDPQAQGIARQMGTAYNLDPATVEKAIRQSSEESRAIGAAERDAQRLELSRERGDRAAEAAVRDQERLEIARSDALIRQREAAVRQQELQEAQVQDQVAKFLEGASASGRTEEAIFQVPSEHRMFAREYLQRIENFNAEAAARVDKMAENVPLSSDELERYRELLGDEAIEGYEKQVRMTPGVARKRLEDLYNVAMREKIKRDTIQDVKAQTPPTGKEIELAQAAVSRELGGFSWPWETTEFSRGQLDSLAYEAARKRRNTPGWAPTKENLENLAKEIFGGSDNEIAGDLPVDVPEDVPPEIWEAMTPEERALWQ